MPDTDEITIDHFDPGIDPETTELEPTREDLTRIEELAEEKGTTPERIAAWAMRRLAASRSAGQKAKDLYDEEKARLDDYLKRARTAAESDSGWFDAILTQHMAALHARTDVKTVHLPDGTLTARKLPDKVVVLDDEGVMLLLRYCQTRKRMGWMKVEFTPKLADLKSALQPAAEVIRLCGPVVYLVETGLLLEGVLWDPKTEQAIRWETGEVVVMDGPEFTAAPVPEDGLLDVTEADGIWLVPGVRHERGVAVPKANPA